MRKMPYKETKHYSEQTRSERYNLVRRYPTCQYNASRTFVIRFYELGMFIFRNGMFVINNVGSLFTYEYKITGKYAVS